MSRTVAPGVKYSASVVITDAWRRSGLGKCGEHFGHLFNLVIETTGNRASVAFCKDPSVQEQIQCINVVVDGLFEVHSVGLHLPLGFFHEDAPTDPFPFRSPPNFRTKRTDKEKGDRFAKEMSIGRKICREILGNMPGVLRQPND